MKNNAIKYDTMYSLKDLENIFNGKFQCGYPSCVKDNYNPSNMIVEFQKCFDIELNEFKCPDWLDNGTCQSTVYFKGW